MAKVAGAAAEDLGLLADLGTLKAPEIPLGDAFPRRRKRCQRMLVDVFSRMFLISCRSVCCDAHDIGDILGLTRK